MKEEERNRTLSQLETADERTDQFYLQSAMSTHICLAIKFEIATEKIPFSWKYEQRQ